MRVPILSFKVRNSNNELDSREIDDKETNPLKTFLGPRDHEAD